MLKLQVIGNCGNNAKVNVSNNKKIINFSLATNRKTANGDELTTWIDCSIWKDEKESTEIQKYLEKGTKLYCEGFPVVSTYTNKQGVVLPSLKLNVNYIEILSKKLTDQEKPTEEVQPENWEKSRTFIGQGQGEEPPSDDLPF